MRQNYGGIDEVLNQNGFYNLTILSFNLGIKNLQPGS